MDLPRARNADGDPQGALDFIGVRKGSVFGMQDILAEDGTTYDMICKANTVGVFQIESRAQKSMLPRSDLRDAMRRA